MSINKKTFPTGTAPTGFVQPVINFLQALAIDTNHKERKVGSYIKQGAAFCINGELFIADSDTEITGTKPTTTDAVKFTISGDIATPIWATDLSDISWDGEYQGYYDTARNYYFVQDEGWIGVTLPLFTYDNTTYEKIRTGTILRTGTYSITTGVYTVTKDNAGATVAVKLLRNDATNILEGSKTGSSESNQLVETLDSIFLTYGETIAVYAKIDVGTYGGLVTIAEVDE